METFFKKSGKSFLTDKPLEDSAVCWHVQVDFEGCCLILGAQEKGRNYTSVEATLRLQDCDRAIRMEFDIYGKEVTQDEIDSKLNKLKTLIKELENFGSALEEGYQKALEHNSLTEEKKPD